MLGGEQKKCGVLLAATQDMWALTPQRVALFGSIVGLCAWLQLESDFLRENLPISVVTSHRTARWFWNFACLLGLTLVSIPARATEPRVLIEGMQANIGRFNPVVCEWECKQYKAVDLSAALAGQLEPTPGEGGLGRWIASANHQMVSVRAQNAEPKQVAPFLPKAKDTLVATTSMEWLSDGTVLLHPSSVSWMHALFSRDEENFRQFSPVSTPWNSFAGFPPLGILRTELLRHLDRGELEAGTSQDLLGRPTET